MAGPLGVGVGVWSFGGSVAPAAPQDVCAESEDEIECEAINTAIITEECAEAEDEIEAVQDEGSEPDTLLRIHTFFSSTTWTPVESGKATLECWGGGGGGTTATGGGGGGAYARDDEYDYTANVGVTVTIGEAAAAGGGTGGTTSIGSTCVAVGAVGNSGGLAASCTGDVRRSGGAGATGTGNSNGGASPGSVSAASGVTPGEPDGAPGASANSNNGAKRPGGGGRSSPTSQFGGAPGVARITRFVAGDSSVPPVIGVSAQRSNGTSHDVVVPLGDDDNDTIYYFVFSDGAPSIQLAGGAGSAVLSQDSGGACKVTVLKHAAASAPTNIETNAAEQVEVHVYRVGAVASESGTAASASGSDGAPPNHDMGSSAPTLQIIGLCCDSTTTTGDITGNAPSGFEDSLFGPVAAAGAGVACMTAWRYVTDDELTAGNFTHQNTANVTFTMGVR